MKHKKMGKLERKALRRMVARRLSMARNSITMTQSDLHQVHKIIGENLQIIQFMDALERLKENISTFENEGQWEKYLDFQLNESKSHE